jgi:hypothetical protein
MSPSKPGPKGGVESTLQIGLGARRATALAVVENVAGTTAKIAGYLDWVGSWLSGLHGTRPSPRGRARDVEIHTKTRP